MVIHHCSTKGPHAHVVRELNLVNISAIALDMGSVVDLVGVIYQAHASCPIPSPLGEVGVGVVVGVPGKAGAEVEEAAIRNGVLVVVSTEERVHLPPQSSKRQRKVRCTGLGRPALTLRYMYYQSSQPGC